MSDHNEHHRRPPADKLPFFKSPVVSCGGQATVRCSHSSLADKHGEAEDCRSDKLPEFERHEEPTLLEIFFDLFLAANYNVFSDTQQITNHARFKGYTGYFCLLWLTWFLVTLFDVRYVTDSIFSRLTRAIQLGVLVGFAVVAPKFDPTDQHVDTMRTMSLILMLSRACLAVEYGSTLWHVRRFSQTRLPLTLQIAVHSIAAAVYLVVAFSFRKSSRSSAFMAWYFFSGAEAIFTILLSNFSPVLSLTKTHLMKRMTLLTVMIMGDGIVQMAKEVVVIVENPDAWNSVIIGLVSAATLTIYFVLLIYFDWLRSSFYLPAWRQQAWTSIHLPFHLALVMFTQGFSQFLIWSKIVDVSRRVTSGIGSLSLHSLASSATSVQVRDKLKDGIELFFKDYPPTIFSTWATVDTALANLTQIPDAFWPDLLTFLNTHDPAVLTRAGRDAPDIFVQVLDVLKSSMMNALFATFGIDLESDITTKNPAANLDDQGVDFQGHVQDKTWQRYNLVFAYTYIAAGCSLFFMVVLTTIARTPLKAWPVIRLGIICLLALGTGLTAILFYFPDRSQYFLLSPWVLPAISLVWTVVLILTHINGAGFKRHSHLFKRCVSLPLTPTADGYGDKKPRASDVHNDV